VSDALGLLLAPFAAAVLFVLIHAYLGVHVLRRGIVFADLALAQLSALGATVAFAGGYAPASTAGWAYALLFTGIGAALLTLIRRLGHLVNQEALIGVMYVAASAATILVVDRSPQGAEHVKKILVGSLLTVGPAELARFAALYGAIGLLHWFLRRPLLAASNPTRSADGGTLAGSLWDLVFFLSFGIVVTSSVTTAGVLLVFSLLIVPPLIGFIFSREMRVVLAIAWAVGIGASALGLAGSYVLDLPTGAALVSACALALVVAGGAKALLFVAPERRRQNRRGAARIALGLVLALGLAASLWLLVNPAGDQPLAALLEGATGLGPTPFLAAGERATYAGAGRDMLRFQDEVDRLNAREKAARYEGAPLSDEEIRRIASYQQTYNEMTRGERFVQEVLRTKARTRERWWVGLPTALVSALGLALLLRPQRRRRPATDGAAGGQLGNPVSG
jgi:zinc/manganese transport system permease protein